MSIKQAIERVTSGRLLDMTLKAENLDYLKTDGDPNFVVPSFSSYITSLLKGSRSACIRRANLDRSSGYKVFAGTRNPTRDTVLQLAFGLEADYPTAQEMLKIAGMAPLYERVKRDNVIIYCLNAKKSIDEAQEALDELGLPLLGREPK